MNGFGKVYKWLKFARNGLLPPTCLLCGLPGAADQNLCAGCHSDLPRITAGCARCGRPLPVPGTCGECQQSPPPFSRCVAPYRYARPLDRLIVDLKFHDKLVAAGVLAQLLAEAVVAAPGGRPDCLLPVPLHPSRLRERGFNQAVELARPLGRVLDLPVIIGPAQRIARTASQSQLTAAARRRNVRGAFAIDWPEPPVRVALLDDVLSTGSTAAELARALRRAGVREVEVWVVARAVVD